MLDSDPGNLKSKRFTEEEVHTRRHFFLRYTVPFYSRHKSANMVLSGLWVETNGRFLGADGAVPLKVCPAGAKIYDLCKPSAN